MRGVLALLVLLALAARAFAQPMGGGRVLLYADGTQVQNASKIDFWNFAITTPAGEVEVHLPTATTFNGTCTGDVCGELCAITDFCGSTVDVDSGRIIMPQGAANPGTCTLGEYFFNTSALAAYACIGGNVWQPLAVPGQAQTVVTADCAGAACPTNVTTETALCSLATAANSLTLGRTYRITAGGRLSSGTSSALLLRVRYDAGTATGTVLCDPLAQSVATGVVLTNTLVNETWQLECLVTVRSTGSSGTAAATGFAIYPASATTSAILVDPNTASTVVINTQSASGLTVYSKWNAASSGQAVTLDECVIEQVS